MPLDNLLMKLRVRDEVSLAEEGALRDAISQVRDCPADRHLLREGQEPGASTLLLDGLVCRYRDLRNAERQITALHISGDFVDLHSFSLKSVDHNIMTLTPCRVATVPHARLLEITETRPHLTRLLWFLTNLDAAIQREWEVSLGRRSALARTAHIFCELRVRLSLIGQAAETGYKLKLTQIEISECIGLTAVHLNRTLRELRERGLMEFRRGEVTIMDLPALEELAEFRPAYLHLEHRPH
ncbi:MAG TPA: Crp/Fnr family transcriptional regulator [Allosphingosinicella sp.]|nr:Crp/Fnr family transcriptional regulator [Allosphingosinicella sp.]